MCYFKNEWATKPESSKKKFRLNKINRVKDYFISEIQERNTISKKLSKYIAAFDYIDKPLIVLSATSRGISIMSFTSVIGVPAGMASQYFTLLFFFNYGNNKEIVKNNKKEKEKTQ